VTVVCGAVLSRAPNRSVCVWIQEFGLKLQIALNTFAREVFRDQADQDYISARSIYKLHFREQFLWSSLQAIEKYLKAILLYNGVSCRYKKWPTPKGPEFGHDIVALFEAVKRIADISFTCPERVEEFVGYLNRLGPNRYFDRVTYARGDEIHRLDETVWYIRRYCENLHFEVPDPVVGKKDIVRERATSLKSPELLAKPWRFRLFRGLLEKILDGESSPARDALVWKNFFYGKRGKNVVTYQSLAGFANPPNVWPWARDPSIRPQLEKYVKLPPI
jgi:HEPN domain-containing protein